MQDTMRTPVDVKHINNQILQNRNSFNVAESRSVTSGADMREQTPAQRGKGADLSRTTNHMTATVPRDRRGARRSDLEQSRADMSQEMIQDNYMTRSRLGSVGRLDSAGSMHEENNVTVMKQI